MTPRSLNSQQKSVDASLVVDGGEFPLNAAVSVSINVSEDGRCSTSITEQPGAGSAPPFADTSSQQARIVDTDRCTLLGGIESSLASPKEGLQQAPQPREPSFGLQQACSPVEAPWNGSYSRQGRYSASGPEVSTTPMESSPDVVVTSMNSPPSAQKCASPTSSAHFDSQRLCEQDPTASVAFLQDRLQSKSEEIAELKAEIRRLQRSRLLSVEGLQADGDTVTLPAAELSALKKDLEGNISVEREQAVAVQDQERIIAAYGDENKVAAQQIKALEGRLRDKDEEMRGERQRLESEFMRHMEAQRQRSAGTATKLQRVLQLEGQLNSLQEDSQMRQAEMQATIDTLRQDKRTLEAQVAGVNLQAVEAGDPLVLQVREEMAAMKAQYESHVSALQEKLEWYANNQRLLTDNDALLAKQAATISELSARLEAQPSSKASSQRIADLTKQVSELKRALAGSEKGVMATLVREAAAPLHEQEAEAQALRKEVARQTARVAEVEEAAERKQRALEQQLENLRVCGEGRSDTTGGAAAAAAAATADAEAARQQVEQIRSRYQQQIQSLQAQLQSERSARTTNADPGVTVHDAALDDLTNTLRDSGEEGTAGDVVNASQRMSKQWVRLRQQQVEARKHILAKDNLIASLQSQLQRQQEQAGIQSKATEEHVVSLQTHLRDLREEASKQAAAREVLQAELRAATDAQRRSEEARHQSEQRSAIENSNLRTQVAELSSRLEASQAVAASVQQSVTAVTSALADAREQHTAELKRMAAANETLVAAAAREAAAAEARAGCNRTLALESELARARQRLETLEEELQMAKHSKVWAPSARDMVVLENQIREMSQQLTAQRMQWPPTPHVGLPEHSPKRLAIDHDGSSRVAAGAGSRPYSNSEVQDKLQYLNDQVDKVIQFASALQKHQEGAGGVRRSGNAVGSTARQSA